MCRSPLQGGVFAVVWNQRDAEKLQRGICPVDDTPCPSLHLSPKPTCRLSRIHGLSEKLRAFQLTSLPSLFVRNRCLDSGFTDAPDPLQHLYLTNLFPLCRLEAHVDEHGNVIE